MPSLAQKHIPHSHDSVYWRVASYFRILYRFLKKAIQYQTLKTSTEIKSHIKHVQKRSVMAETRVYMLSFILKTNIMACVYWAPPHNV